MNVAQLTIEMAANVARLKTDMAAARNTVDSTMNSIRKSAGLAAGALGAIGIGLSGAAFAGWIKGAINAADETNKLAQKIGLSVKEIGGLQLAFQQGGVNAEAMQKSLAKLNVNISNGDAAFKALGVTTKNADGSLRSTTSVLIDIADKFANTQNGAAKTAMAMEIFGKSGVDLIPVLNAGGESIKEFGELAEKLGLVLSEDTAAAAEKFNDTLELISLGGRGVANQIMAELLPTFQSLAGEFLTLITSGNNLKDVATFISTSLKVLFTVVGGGIEIMRSLLIMTKATAQAFMALGSGDFSGIAKIFTETEKTLKENWMTTLGSFDRLWNQTGNTAIEAASKIVKGTVQSTKAMEDAEKAAKKLADEQQKSLESAAALLESIVFENKTLQMSNVEREIAINLRKLEATGLEENTALYNAYANAIKNATVDNEAIKERIKLEEEAAKKTQKIAEDYAKEMDQINNQIGQSLTDALVNGGKSAKEFLIDMFRTLILRPILQPIITGATGTVMAALGLGGSGNAMASNGGAAGTFNIMSSVKSAYDMVSGGFMSLGTQAAFAAESMGAWLVNNTTGYLNSLGGSMMANSGAIGSFTSGAAGIGAGIMAGEFISGGKSVIGGNSLYTTGGGAAAGAALGTFVFPGVGTAIGGLVGGIVGGVVNAAFGSGAKNATGTNIQGTLTTQGLVGARSGTSWEKKGGWFGGGGSGTDFTSISAGLQTFMDDALKSVTAAAEGYAKTLGISTDALANATHFFSIPANSAEEASAYLEKELRGFANLLAQNLLVNTNYAKENETAIDTLSRLATSINTVNGVFGALGFKLYEVSLSGANAASSFVDLMGGFDSFTQSMEFYYQNFYTDAERTAKATENLSKVFASINLEMPATNQGFRALVESARAAGDDALLANLLKLAPAFIQISESAEAATQKIIQERNALLQELSQLTGNTSLGVQTAVQTTDEYNRALRNHIAAIKDAKAAYASAKTATDAALSNLQRVIDKQKSAIEENRQTVQTSINSLSSLFDYIKGQIKDLYSSTAATSETALANAWQYINTLVSTGGTPDQDTLSGAVATIRASLTESSYKTAFELSRDRMLLAGSLEKVAFRVQDQLSTEELQLEALDDQITKLNDIYQKAVDQVNEARGIKSSVDDAANTIEGALAYLGSTLAAEISSLATLTTLSGSGTFPSETDWRKQQISGIYQSVLERAPDVAGLEYWAGTNLTLAEVTSAIENSTENRYQDIKKMYETVLGRTPDVAGLDYWVNSSLGLAGVEAAIKGSAEGKLRGYADGGYYSGGLAMVGENGPELINFNDPGMVYNASQTSRILTGGDDVVVEIRNLREENKVQSRALVNLQNRVTRLLERWDGDGLPETRVVTA